MITLEDLFLDAWEDAGHVRTWPAAVDLHEHTKLLVSEFAKRQGSYSVDECLALRKRRNATLVAVRDALHRTRIERDVAVAAEDRRRHLVERAERLEALDRELVAGRRETEDRGESRGVAGHAFEDLMVDDIHHEQRSRGWER